MYSVSWRSGNQPLKLSAPELSRERLFHCYIGSSFYAMQCTRKPRDHVFMCPLSLLWHKVGLLAPWYIIQELISINQVICEPSERHCRQGRKILARICINSSKNASASPPGWKGLLQSACYQVADWSQEMIPCWGLRVDLSCWQVTYPSSGRSSGERKLILIELCTSSISAHMTASSWGPCRGLGVVKTEAGWCQWTGNFVYLVFSVHLRHMLSGGHWCKAQRFTYFVPRPIGPSKGLLLKCPCLCSYSITISYNIIILLPKVFRKALPKGPVSLPQCLSGIPPHPKWTCSFPTVHFQSAPIFQGDPSKNKAHISFSFSISGCREPFPPFPLPT